MVNLNNPVNRCQTFGLGAAAALSVSGCSAASNKVAAPAKVKDLVLDFKDNVSVFNYGPDIATLRKNSVKETGLTAPKQPVWKTAPLAEAAE